MDLTGVRNLHGEIAHVRKLVDEEGYCKAELWQTAIVKYASRPGERVGHPELFPGAHSHGGPMGAHRE